MEWGVKKLGELLKVQNGYAFNSKLFTNETGTPLIRIRDIKKGIGTVTNFNGSYDKKYEVKSGDFLIGMDGEFGCYEWKGDTALLNQRVCRLQDFSNRINSRFLFYGINKYLKAIEEVTAFATVKHISSKQIEAIEIPLPPLPEQKRIVAILDEAFESIAKAKESAEKNLKNANEIFESYLQNVFENNGDGWQEKTLGNFLKLEYGKPLDKSKRKSEGKYPVYGANGEKNRTDEFYHDKFSIIIGRKGSAGEINFTERKFWPLDVTYFITFDDNKYSLNFIYYLLSGLNLPSLAKGVKPGINRNEVYSINVQIPSLTEQQAIVTKLDALSTETKKLEAIYTQKLTDLEELKKSILTKAFNGELTEASA